VAEKRTLAFDRCVVALWEAADPAADMAIAATGGYGRRRLVPGSDLDVLFVYGPGRRDETAKVVDAVLYPLWNDGVQASHAVRTPAECRVEAEARTGPGRQRGTVEIGDDVPDRQAGEHRMRQRGVREAHRDLLGDETRGEPIRYAGQGILLVHDDRDAEPLGREVGRHRHVAAEPDDDVGVGRSDRACGRIDGSAQPARYFQQLHGRAARQRHPRDHRHRQVVLGEHRALESFDRPDAVQGDGRVATAQFLGQADQR